MLRFYFRLARKVPALIRSSTSAVNMITATLVTLATAVGPWLVKQGQGDLATLAAKVPGWWSVVPVTALVLLGLLKANYVLNQGVESERDALVKRLDDRAQRHADAEELGRLRQRMRKRYLQWLKEFNSLLNTTVEQERAFDLQEEIATRLETDYGFDVRDRFITADNADSLSTFLSESQEYAARIKRLRGIIKDIRRGRIRRRVIGS